MVPPIEEKEEPMANGWEWPYAWDDVVFDGTYVGAHPTRYNWRPDVEQVARYLVDNYDVWCNTYYEHPPGYGNDVASTDDDGSVWYVSNVSLDIWNSQGRGFDVDPAVGQAAFDAIFNNGQP